MGNIKPTDIPLDISVKFWLERLQDPDAIIPGNNISSVLNGAPKNKRARGSPPSSRGKSPSVATNSEVPTVATSSSHSATNDMARGRQVRGRQESADRPRPVAKDWSMGANTSHSKANSRACDAAKEIQRFIKTNGIKQLDISSATGISQSHLSQHLNHGIGLNAMKHAALWKWYREEKASCDAKGFSRSNSVPVSQDKANDPKQSNPNTATVPTTAKISSGQDGLVVPLEVASSNAAAPVHDRVRSFPSADRVGEPPLKRSKAKSRTQA